MAIAILSKLKYLIDWSRDDEWPHRCSRKMSRYPRPKYHFVLLLFCHAGSRFQI